MAKKYKFTGEVLEYQGRQLQRIRRLSDGQLGGWIESERNLSHAGQCWVADEAKVFDTARVDGTAVVRGYAVVCGDATVDGHAVVSEHAIVCGSAHIRHSAHVSGAACVDDHAVVCGNATVTGNCRVASNAWIGGDALVRSDADYWCESQPGWSWHITYTRSDNMLKIGCQRDTVANWRERGWHGRQPNQYDGSMARFLKAKFDAPELEPQPNMRPCRPGDVLVERRLDDGARYLITMLEPQPHPAKGTTSNHAVTVQLEVRLPAQQHPRRGSLDFPLTDYAKTLCAGIEILGLQLEPDWGSLSSGKRYRLVQRRLTTVRLRDTVEQLRRSGDEALASWCKLQQELRALAQQQQQEHAASVLRQEQARAQIYAEWLVEDK